MKHIVVSLFSEDLLFDVLHSNSHFGESVINVFPLKVSHSAQSPKNDRKDKEGDEPTMTLLLLVSRLAIVILSVIIIMSPTSTTALFQQQEFLRREWSFLAHVGWSKLFSHCHTR